MCMLNTHTTHVYTETYTFTCAKEAHTQTHKRAHMSKHPGTLTCTCMQGEDVQIHFTHSHLQRHTCTLTRVHMNSYAHQCKHECGCTEMLTAFAQRRTDVDADMREHSHSCTFMITQLHAHAHSIHAHAHSIHTITAARPCTQHTHSHSCTPMHRKHTCAHQFICARAPVHILSPDLVGMRGPLPQRGQCSGEKWL